MLGYLQTLTDHLLSVDSNGNVYIAASATGNLSFAHGNRLLRRMIASKHTVTIDISQGHGINIFLFDPTHASTRGVGTGGAIYFDPSSTTNTYTANTRGISSREIVPTNMILAHELIHADRAMRGVVIPTYQMDTVTLQLERASLSPMRLSGSQTRIVTHTLHRDEMATIGIRHHSASDITENMIRSEHGLRRRSSHY